MCYESDTKSLVLYKQSNKYELSFLISMDWFFYTFGHFISFFIGF